MLQVSFPLGSRSLTVYGLTQYDYGQELEVHGLPLPAVVECQISLQRVGGTTESLAGVVVDDTLTLAIPDTYLAADTDCDYTIYVYIYVTTEASGTTVYLVSLPVTARSMPEGYVPGETSPFAAVIEEITELVEEAQDAATLSESYAKGGTGTRTGEDTDNSKYYSEEARDAEAGAADSAAEARASEVAAAGSASTAAAASTSAAEAKTAAEAARDTATAKATEAANSASAAGVSAAAASASETAAGAYASTAGASAVSAASSASAAGSSATSAASSASSAESSATAAAAAKQDALTAISGAKTTAVNAVAAEGATQVAAVTAEGTAQKAAVQSKGAEVIASIPEDYTELSNDVSSLKSEINNKANIDGSYEQLTAGNAEQLVSSVGIEDKVPYNFRTSGGAADIGNRETDKIIGGTVAWNQLSQLINYTQTIYGISVVLSTDNKMEISGTPEQTGQLTTVHIFKDSLTVGHVYMISCKDTGNNLQFRRPAEAFMFYSSTIFKSTTQNTDIAIRARSTDSAINYESYINTFDLTQMFGSTIADYIYSLETATTGAGVAWFQKLFPKPYYEYNAGELMSVNTSMHRMVGFNQWDEEWEVGGYYTATGLPWATTDRIRSKNPIQILPNTVYCFIPYNYYDCYLFFYDGNGDFINTQLIGASSHVFTTPANAKYLRFNMGTGYGTTYNHDICINLSWDGERNGEYEPYKKWEYPLDSSLTLRGIPKLDENNELYYNGDEYESDGTVTRRYGIVDLGTFTWSEYSGYPGLFYVNAVPEGAKIPASNTVVPNLIAEGYYAAISRDIGTAGHTKGEIALAVNRIYISNDDYTGNVSGFRTAISGVMLVYELAEPNTETADLYQNPQIVDDFGTEEYVDYSEAQGTRDVAIPVGHDTFYQSNLKAKLEMAPNSPEGDGDYVVRQSGGENTYVPLVIPKEIPNAPTTDGNYTLRATVSNGTATLTWVAQS